MIPALEMDHTINLERAVGQFYQPLYRLAYGLTRNEAEASDLTRQTFLRLARQGHPLRTPNALKSWTLTTLCREFLRLARRQSRRPEVASRPRPHDLGAGGDVRTILEALDRVEPSYQEALQLFYLAGLSHGEIAQALEAPLATVLSRLARGKDQLRAKLTSWPPRPET
jgi:RNA polymerase sigma-70 factor, ECF subfamily